MKVEKLKCNGNSLEDIQKYIAECASVVRDKDPKSAEKLFNRLLTESYGNKASRVLEFIPCKVSSIFDEKSGQLFGFFGKDDYYYTNLRELLNWGVSLETALKYVDFTNYAVFKCEAPYFVYGQISTHTQLTTVSHSQRYAECDRGYWYPPEYKEDNKDLPDSAIQTLWDKIVGNKTPLELQRFMKDTLGVKRREVWVRGSDMLQNRVFTIGGYTNNPNAWEHFINQRLDSHTQLETRILTQMIKGRL